MRIAVALLALFLGSAAQAATIGADVFLRDASGPTDYVHDGRNGASLDIGEARAESRVAIPGGEITGRSSADASARSFSLGGDVRRSAGGAQAMAYSDARLSFYFVVDRPTDVTFGLAFRGSRRAVGAIASATSLLRIDATEVGSGVYDTASYDRSAPDTASFADSISVNSAARPGRTYWIEAYLASSIAGTFSSGIHALDAVYDIGVTGGAALMVVDYKPAPVPLPAAGLLLLTAIGALGALRSGRRVV